MNAPRNTDPFAKVTLFLAILAVLAVAINILIFSLLYPIIVTFDPLPSWAEPSGHVVGVCFLLIGIAHLTLLGVLGWQIKLLQQAEPGHALLFALGVVSSILLLSNVPLLSDVGNQYEAKLGTQGEWFMLFLNHGTHFMFLTLAAGCASFTRRTLAQHAQPEPAERDEAIFLNTHYIGAFSGVLGLVVMAVLVATGFPSRFLAAAVMVFSGIALAPYIVSFVTWLILKRDHALREWCDEKQFLDIARAGLTTLTIAIPVLLVCYLAQRITTSDYMVRDLWFPTVAFLNLLIFSVSTVVFSRRSG